MPSTFEILYSILILFSKNRLAVQVKGKKQNHKIIEKNIGQNISTNIMKDHDTFTYITKIEKNWESEMEGRRLKNMKTVNWYEILTK
jgi:hypothetical protein